MTIRPFIKAASIFALLLALTSCGSIPTDLGLAEDEGEKLAKSVEAFNGAFRWEEYKGASSFVEPAKKEQFWKLADTFKGKVRIIDFNIREMSPAKDRTGVAVIQFQYYLTDAPTVKTLTITQKWAFSPKEKTWRITHSGLQALLKDE